MRVIGQHVGVPRDTVGQLQHSTVIAMGKYLLWLLSKLLRIQKIWFLADILLLHGVVMVSFNFSLLIEWDTGRIMILNISQFLLLRPTRLHRQLSLSFQFLSIRKRWLVVNIFADLSNRKICNKSTRSHFSEEKVALKNRRSKKAFMVHSFPPPQRLFEITFDGRLIWDKYKCFTSSFLN